jgi:hypothetical protein
MEGGTRVGEGEEGGGAVGVVAVGEEEKGLVLGL